MTEQEQLNITTVNEWSLDFADDWKKFELMKFSDGEVNFEITEIDSKKRVNFNIKKEQKEYLIKWLQS